MTASRSELTATSPMRWLPGTPEELCSAAQYLISAGDGRFGALVQDATGSIVGVDSTAERLLGLDWDQLVGLTSMDPRWQAVSEDGLPMPGEQHPPMVALRTGRSVVGEVIGVLMPGGSTAWLEITAHPLAATSVTDAAPQGVLALFADISATPRGRAASDALVRAFRMLAENASDVVLRLDVDGRCQWASPSAEKLTGRPPAELIGARPAEFLHPDDHRALVRRSAGLRNGSELLNGRFRLRGADGGYRWMSAVARLEGGEDGRDGAVVVALQDVHDQVLSTSRLAASESRHRMLAENSSDVVMHLRGFRLAWVSPSVRDALGFAPSDLLGQDVRSLLTPGDVDALERIRADSVAGRSYRGRIRVPGQDGGSVWFDVAGRPIVDDHGLPDGVVLQLRNVSAEVETARRVAVLQRQEALTGPTSRWELTQRMRTVSPATVAGGRRPAVGLCRVDRYTQVLDEQGAPAARALLDGVLTGITNGLRSGDVAIWLGGDEIAVVLDDVRDLTDAREAFARIDRALRAGQLSVTLGMRVAEAGEDFRSLLLRADAASTPGEPLGGSGRPGG